MNFQTILNLPPEPRPESPVAVEQLETLEFDDVFFQHASASQPALDRDCVSGHARGDDCVCRTVGIGEDYTGEAAGGTVPASVGTCLL